MMEKRLPDVQRILVTRLGRVRHFSFLSSLCNEAFVSRRPVHTAGLNM